MAFREFFEKVTGTIGLCGFSSLEAGSELLIEGHHNAGTAIMLGLGLVLLFFLLNYISNAHPEPPGSSVGSARPGLNSYTCHSLSTGKDDPENEDESGDGDDAPDYGDFCDCGDF
ncbi:hypothetical protein RJ40_00130 [Methanofollis aquaemaris]|uniref:Uncharacterized protein n=1 Tax=Methanofollis aquaemaris TaxID=126734 RepID=A0A8A3S073_9EURY|nr:hypothetical protein [Methanofollis aquaemaris]QSZ66018.1 hypothetical protein RJ40_00130 [Methanofollis aquaemaris]